VGILAKLFGAKSQGLAKPVEHAVIVNFSYGGSTDLGPIFALEERLTSDIAAAGAGEYDGNEVATDGSDGTLYMYGPDADALFSAVRPALEACDFMRGAVVRLRYGQPTDGVKEREVLLPPNISLQRDRDG
jgi:hypothetical protein